MFYLVNNFMKCGTGHIAAGQLYKHLNVKILGNVWNSGSAFLNMEPSNMTYFWLKFSKVYRRNSRFPESGKVGVLAVREFKKFLTGGCGWARNKSIQNCKLVPARAFFAEFKEFGQKCYYRSWVSGILNVRLRKTVGN